MPVEPYLIKQLESEWSASGPFSVVWHWRDALRVWPVPPAPLPAVLGPPRPRLAQTSRVARSASHWPVLPSRSLQTAQMSLQSRTIHRTRRQLLPLMRRGGLAAGRAAAFPCTTCPACTSLNSSRSLPRWHSDPGSVPLIEFTLQECTLRREAPLPPL